MEHMGITIDPNKDSLFDQLGVMRLKESYMTEDEISPQERFAYVSKTFGSNIEHAQRLYDYVSKHWLSYSTPILSYGRSKRGLPISCYLNYINDTAEGLVENLSETNWLSMLGGGVGIGFGIRSADDISTGVMPHLKMYDASSYRFSKTLFLSNRQSPSTFSEYKLLVTTSSLKTSFVFVCFSESHVFSKNW